MLYSLSHSCDRGRERERWREIPKRYLSMLQANGDRGRDGMDHRETHTLSIVDSPDSNFTFLWN